MRVESGSYRGLGVPVRLSRTPGRAGGGAPGFARHTDEVLAEAGLSVERIADLRERGILPVRRKP